MKNPIHLFLSILLSGMLTLSVCHTPEVPSASVSPTPPPSSVPSETPAPIPSATPVITVKPTPPPIPKPASSKQKLYILMYHSVAEDGTECNDWTITASRLREDLRWMADNGYTTILPRELAAGVPLPEKAVMLTFDDGYADNYTLLYPILQEYQAKAVISLVTKWISDEYATEFMDWEQCREMAESGLVEFGSHTHGLHAGGIVRLEGETREEYEARVLPDLQRSIDLIQEHTGTAPIFFAYPHGKTDSWAADFLSDHFSMTVITLSAPADLSGGAYQLPRYNVTVNNTASRFLK